jgi:hypothetical protein
MPLAALRRQGAQGAARLAGAEARGMRGQWSRVRLRCNSKAWPGSQPSLGAETLWAYRNGPRDAAPRWVQRGGFVSESDDLGSQRLRSSFNQREDHEDPESHWTN